MNRKEELISIVSKNDPQNKLKFSHLIDEVLFIEENLKRLRKLPFIKIHPYNPDLQKSTPAAKQYKELLQQYTNCLKVLSSASGDDGSTEESPLRKWVNKYV